MVYGDVPRATSRGRANPSTVQLASSLGSHDRAPIVVSSQRSREFLEPLSEQLALSDRGNLGRFTNTANPALGVEGRTARIQHSAPPRGATAGSRRRGSPVRCRVFSGRPSRAEERVPKRNAWGPSGRLPYTPTPPEWVPSAPLVPYQWDQCAHALDEAPLVLVRAVGFCKPLASVVLSIAVPLAPRAAVLPDRCPDRVASRERCAGERLTGHARLGVVGRDASGGAGGN